MTPRRLQSVAGLLGWLGVLASAAGSAILTSVLIAGEGSAGSLVVALALLALPPAAVAIWAGLVLRSDDRVWLWGPAVPLLVEGVAFALVGASLLVVPAALFLAAAGAEALARRSVSAEAEADREGL